MHSLAQQCCILTHISCILTLQYYVIVDSCRKLPCRHSGNWVDRSDRISPLLIAHIRSAQKYPDVREKRMSEWSSKCTGTWPTCWCTMYVAHQTVWFLHAFTMHTYVYAKSRCRHEKSHDLCAWSTSAQQNVSMFAAGSDMTAESSNPSG